MACLALAATFLAGCGITVSDNSTPVPTVFVPSVLPPGVPSPTLPGGTNSAATAAPKWSSLGLTGHLIYSLGIQGIQQLELRSGKVKNIFQPPKDAWLTASSVSPDGQQIAIAYAPPPPAGQAQLGYASLYLLPGDCPTRPSGCTTDDLKLLVDRVDPHEAYFSPVWAPGGKTLYFAHFTPSNSGTNSPFKYTLEQITLPDGKPLALLQDALWPNISPDGNKIVYVYSDPKNYTNHLLTAGPDGSNPRDIVGPAAFAAVDAPFFTPDGTQLVFSAVGEGPAAGTPTPSPALTWLDQLLGVRVAAAASEAHNVPSDWWEINVDGSQLRRLTKQYNTSMFGAFAPDGKHIGYLSASGLYVMNPDGTALQRLLNTTGYGTIDWLP
jgi:hypothetical protein